METETTFNEDPIQGPPPPQPPPPPIRRLQRGPGGPVGGVATGIGYYFGIDPVIVQIAFVVLTVFGYIEMCHRSRDSCPLPCKAALDVDLPRDIAA